MQFGATPRRALPGALVVPADGHGCVLPALTYFYDNALGGYQDLLDGVLELPLPADHRLQQLDRADLGSFAEFVLRDPHLSTGRRIELASDAPTPAGMTAAISAALARPVRFRPPPTQAVRLGNPDMAAMWDYLRGRGYQADITALHRTYPTIARTSFTTWAHRTFGPGEPAHYDSSR